MKGALPQATPARGRPGPWPWPRRRLASSRSSQREPVPRESAAPRCWWSFRREAGRAEVPTDQGGRTRAAICRRPGTSRVGTMPLRCLGYVSTRIGQAGYLQGLVHGGWRIAATPAQQIFQHGASLLNSDTVTAGHFPALSQIRSDEWLCCRVRLQEAVRPPQHSGHLGDTGLSPSDEVCVVRRGSENRCPGWLFGAVVLVVINARAAITSEIAAPVLGSVWRRPLSCQKPHNAMRQEEG
jgi:hypothetical protein